MLFNTDAVIDVQNHGNSCSVGLTLGYKNSTDAYAAEVPHLIHKLIFLYNQCLNETLKNYTNSVSITQNTSTSLLDALESSRNANNQPEEYKDIDFKKVRKMMLAPVP